MIIYYLAGADVIMYSMLVLNIQGNTKVTSVEFLTEKKSNNNLHLKLNIKNNQIS